MRFLVDQFSGDLIEWLQYRVNLLIRIGVGKQFWRERGRKVRKTKDDSQYQG